MKYIPIHPPVNNYTSFAINLNVFQDADYNEFRHATVWNNADSSWRTTHTIWKPLTREEIYSQIANDKKYDSEVRAINHLTTLTMRLDTFDLSQGLAPVAIVIVDNDCEYILSVKLHDFASMTGQKPAFEYRFEGPLLLSEFNPQRQYSC